MTKLRASAVLGPVAALLFAAVVIAGAVGYAIETERPRDLDGMPWLLVPFGGGLVIGTGGSGSPRAWLSTGGAAAMLGLALGTILGAAGAVVQVLTG